MTSHSFIPHWSSSLLSFFTHRPVLLLILIISLIFLTISLIYSMILNILICYRFQSSIYYPSSFHLIKLHCTILHREYNAYLVQCSLPDIYNVTCDNLNSMLQETLLQLCKTNFKSSTHINK